MNNVSNKREQNEFTHSAECEKGATKLNENFELEDMRQQLNTLMKKLEKQEIVNDRMIRQSMKKNVVGINRTYLWLSVLCVLMIPYSYFVFVKLSHFSILFWLYTCIFVTICVVATYYNRRNLSDANMMTKNLLDVRRRMARAKKFDANWLYFGVPGVLIFIGWFMYDVYQKNNDVLNDGLFWGGIVGGVFGTILGIKMHFKTQRQYQEIIDEIEDLRGDE